MSSMTFSFCSTVNCSVKNSQWALFNFASLSYSFLPLIACSDSCIYIWALRMKFFFSMFDFASSISKSEFWLSKMELSFFSNEFSLRKAEFPFVSAVFYFSSWSNWEHKVAFSTIVIISPSFEAFWRTISAVLLGSLRWICWCHLVIHLTDRECVNISFTLYN